MHKIHKYPLDHTQAQPCPRAVGAEDVEDDDEADDVDGEGS